MVSIAMSCEPYHRSIIYRLTFPREIINRRNLIKSARSFLLISRKKSISREFLKNFILFATSNFSFIIIIIFFFNDLTYDNRISLVVSRTVSESLCGLATVEYWQFTDIPDSRLENTDLRRFPRICGDNMRREFPKPRCSCHASNRRCRRGGIAKISPLARGHGRCA